MNRNRVQVDVKEVVEKKKAYASVERALSRNLKSWQDWVDKGYAAAFDEAWKCGMRDVESIATYVATVGGTKDCVNKSLDNR